MILSTTGTRLFFRYLRNQLLRSYLLVAVVLCGLFALLTLVDQLDAVGTGDYRTADAFLYTVLTLPKQAYDWMPLIVLLGSVLGLGVLAASNQLIAIRSLGASIWRILRTVVGTAALVIGSMVFLAEWGIPQLEEQAHSLRSVRLGGETAQVGAQGYWARSGGEFLNVNTFRFGRIPTGINIYQFSNAGGLVGFIHAESASIMPNNIWRLENVWQKQVQPGEERAAVFSEQLEWESFLTADQIGSLAVPPQSLALSDLVFYVNNLRERGENTDVFDLALWQQLIKPFTAFIMALIAVPVAVSSNRSDGPAKRIFQSASLGMLFYLGTSALGYIGLLAEANPAMTTLLPLVILAVVTALMLRRLK